MDEQMLDIYAVPAEDFLSLFAPEGLLKANRPVLCYGDPSYLQSCFIIGCVDFLKDPWTAEELYFRIIRCADSRRISLEDTTLLTFSGLHISNQEGNTISLTYQESLILRTLSRQQGKVLSREVLAHFLGYQMNTRSRVIDVHISSLRKKLRRLLPAASSINPIFSVRGIGYILK